MAASIPDEQAALLAAIVADPDEDTPRLVYADWLEETGEPSNVARAHFIRTQIHLEHTDPKSAVYDEMKALEARILDFYLDDWRYELPDCVRYVGDAVWRRGFVDDLGPMWESGFRQYGSAALRELPLTGVQLTGSGQAVRFEEYPDLVHISRLTLGPSFTPLYTLNDETEETTPTFDSLMAAPVFTSLRHLDLSGNAISDAWLVRFVGRLPAAGFSSTLESLDLSSNFGITDAGANVLATAAGLDGLKKLRLRDTRITPAGRTLLKKRFGNRLA